MCKEHNSMKLQEWTVLSKHLSILSMKDPFGCSKNGHSVILTLDHSQVIKFERIPAKWNTSNIYKFTFSCQSLLSAPLADLSPLSSSVANLSCLLPSTPCRSLSPLLFSCQSLSCVSSRVAVLSLLSPKSRRLVFAWWILLCRCSLLPSKVPYL